MLQISLGTLDKLKTKHRVTRREVEQCFENICGGYLVDTRENHQTDPETLWFIASTNQERLLKIVFIFLNGNIYLKTAYEPNQTEINIYDRLGK